MENEYYPFWNLRLPYAYDAMEPFIDTKTMVLHHGKHLQTYINNLNNVLKGYPRLQKLSLEQLIRGSPQFPADKRDAIRNNAGGVYNHRFYFELLANPTEQEPHGRLRAAIDRSFGSYGEFKAYFKKAASAVFGSGYAWLVSANDKLEIVTTPNQNCPIEQGMSPILTIDVWEHAYYLKHYNVRADYIDDWLKIINWSRAERNFQTRG